MTAKGRGGSREGAGRPRLYQEPMVRKTVTLPPAIVKALEALGDGNLSAGIRALYERGRPSK